MGVGVQGEEQGRVRRGGKEMRRSVKELLNDDKQVNS